ncbi:hypothetical protein ACF3N7_09985 [Cruoricaptor ignavus]|uniref:hypothetical protein n=1 Tax=Cruoricaptor ignavus TaxID=1118202 RepID=UPI00370D05EF
MKYLVTWVFPDHRYKFIAIEIPDELKKFVERNTPKEREIGGFKKHSDIYEFTEAFEVCNSFAEYEAPLDVSDEIDLHNEHWFIAEYDEEEFSLANEPNEDSRIEIFTDGHFRVYYDNDEYYSSSRVYIE